MTVTMGVSITAVVSRDSAAVTHGDHTKDGRRDSIQDLKRRVGRERMENAANR
jgi:hypothetical protein